MLEPVAFHWLPAARSMADDPRLLLAGIYLAGALLVGALLIALLKRWRRHQDTTAMAPEQQLSHYRILYEQGALSQEEFDRLRSLLAREMTPEGTTPNPQQEDRPPELPPEGIRKE